MTKKDGKKRRPPGKKRRPPEAKSGDRSLTISLDTAPKESSHEVRRKSLQSFLLAEALYRDTKEFLAHLATLEFPAKPLRFRLDLKPTDNGDVRLVYGVNGKILRESNLEGWARMEERAQYLSQAFPQVLHFQILEMLRDSQEPFTHGVNFAPIKSKSLHKASYDFTLMRVFYGPLLRAWNRGKRAYKKSLAFANWKDTVRQEVEAELRNVLIVGSNERGAMIDVPELDPESWDELLDRLTVTSFTDGQRLKLKDRQETSPPNELALDHAACLCGVPLYTYSIRQLLTHAKSKR